MIEIDGIRTGSVFFTEKYCYLCARLVETIYSYQYLFLHNPYEKRF